MAIAPAAVAGTPTPPAAAVIDPQLINVKFHDGTDVSTAGSRLTLGNASAQVRLAQLLGTAKAQIGPVFSSAPAAMDARRADLQAAGKDVPDLTSWVQAKLDPAVDTKATIAALLADPLVDYAYVVPKPSPTSLTPAQQTNLTTTASKYLGTGASGLNVLAQAAVPGALGANVDLADIEFAANIGHEDLVRTPATVDAWWNSNQGDAQDHGTMVLGVIAAKRDGNGVDGIAPSTQAHFSSYRDTTSPSGGQYPPAIMEAAAARLAPGSVMTIEISVGPAYEASDPAIANALRTATAAGIIVVEAAGNENVDHNTLTNTSVDPNRSDLDTGAIIVGAGQVTNCTDFGTDPARTKLSFSGFGSRVDVQGPGACVSSSTSNFGGGLFGEYGTNANNGYTYRFDGTSSATAAISGFVAALSGAYKAKVGIPLTPALARATLKSTGQAQAGATATNHIGPLPDLGAAITAIAKADTTAPSQPGGIAAVNGATKITLTWPASTDVIGVTHYDVYRNGSPYGQTRINGFTDAKTVPGTAYTYSVYALDAAGNQSLVRTISVTAAAGAAPTDTSAPYAPQSVSAVANATTPNTRIDVSWPAATDNVAVTGYEVRRDGILIGTTSSTSYSDSTVKPGTYYTYSVAALDAAGNRSTVRAPGASLTGGPRSDVIAPVLAPLTIGGAVDRRIVLGWDPATDAVGTRSYDVYRQTGTNPALTLLDRTAVTNYTDIDVTSNTTYTYRVYAVDGSGNRSVAQTDTWTTNTFAASTDTTRPTAPGPTSTSLDSTNRPVASWTAATDNVGVSTYQLRKNGLYAGSTSALSRTDVDGLPGRYATYSVVPIDAAGNRGPINPAKGIAPAP